MSGNMSLSTDQVAAFVELARLGSLRSAASALFLSEQGLRSRLLALEERIGVELYRKQRGPRHRTALTAYGQQFLPHAVEFLERADQVVDLFRDTDSVRQIHVVASQYLIAYLLIDVVRRFHRAFPKIHVRLSSRTEREIEDSLPNDPDIAFGVAAPYESPPELTYHHLFSMNWSVITPMRHPLAKRRVVRLDEIITFPLITYERGSTGRQHVADAFRHRSLVPEIEIEATNTDLIVRMVEAGLGIAVVPLYHSGAVTRGHRVVIRQLHDQIRPIDSGILLRRNEQPTVAATKFLEFLRMEVISNPV